MCLQWILSFLSISLHCNPKNHFIVPLEVFKPNTDFTGKRLVHWSKKLCMTHQRLYLSFEYKFYRLKYECMHDSPWHCKLTRQCYCYNYFGYLSQAMKTRTWRHAVLCIVAAMACHKKNAVTRKNLPRTFNRPPPLPSPIHIL